MGSNEFYIVWEEIVIAYNQETDTFLLARLSEKGLEYINSHSPEDDPLGFWGKWEELPEDFFNEVKRLFKG